MKTAPLLLATALLAGALGFFIAKNLPARPPASGAGASSARTVRFYQSPMHPWITSDKPGKCTICGMDLVPVYEGDAGAPADGRLVTLTPSAVTTIGVQTSEVRRGPLVRTLRVSGVLDDDETRHRIVSAHVPGRIEKLFVAQVGARFDAGAPIATLYSPEILTAQRLYVERVKAGPGAFTASERADARERLLTLGLLPGEITHLEETLTPSATVTIHAPFAGTVVARSAYEGQYVETHDKLFEIGDLSHLWFVFDAYEADLPWLRVGQTVEIATPSRPGETISAPIAFIDPNLAEATRTARIRVVVDNRDGRLLHRQTATARVRIETPDTTLVPRSAVLHTHAQPVVYLDKSGGAYEPRTVALGRVGDEFHEVAQGLAAGDRVVTQGALLLDSQAQLARGPASPATTAATPAPIENRVTERSDSSASKIENSSADTSALTPLVLAAADAADALAADDVARYEKSLPALRAAFDGYAAAFPDAKNGPLAQFTAGLKTGADLKAARRSFEVFSTAVADLAKSAHLHHRGVVKIFQCPMTPVLGTGRWVQRGENLRNPFFGSAMLECGEQLK